MTRSAFDSRIPIFSGTALLPCQISFCLLGGVNRGDEPTSQRMRIRTQTRGHQPRGNHSIRHAQQSHLQVGVAVGATDSPSSAGDRDDLHVRGNHSTRKCRGCASLRQRERTSSPTRGGRSPFCWGPPHSRMPRQPLLCHSAIAGGPDWDH